MAHVVDGMVARIVIGLPNACMGLNDQAAATLFAQLVAVDRTIALLQNAGHQSDWHAALRRMTGMRSVHGLIAGRAVRILIDAEALEHIGEIRTKHVPISRASRDTGNNIAVLVNDRHIAG